MEQILSLEDFKDDILYTTNPNKVPESILHSINNLKSRSLKPNIVVFIGSKVWNILENIFSERCSYESGIEKEYNYFWADCARYVATYSECPIFLVEGDFWEENQIVVVLISDGWKVENKQYHQKIFPDEIYPKGSFKDYFMIKVEEQ